MKLSKQDKILLQRWGHSDTDYDQIEEALKSRCTKYRVCGKSISRSEAIRLLGWKVFLSGISRSAFHFTAARPTNDGKTIVYFDSSNMFAQTEDLLNEKASCPQTAGFLPTDVTHTTTHLMGYSNYSISHKESQGDIYDSIVYKWGKQ